MVRQARLPAAHAPRVGRQAHHDYSWSGGCNLYGMPPRKNCHPELVEGPRRLKKNGSKIRIGTIQRYSLVSDNLQHFCSNENFTLRIKTMTRANARELKSEKLYWKRFYKKFSEYLYSIGCYDNYVGSQFKVIRTFFGYLKSEKGVYTGDFHKNFYVRVEAIPILVLSTEQLQFLAYNQQFEKNLPFALQKTKDIFVFGCTVGLRFSDLMTLTRMNIEKIGMNSYLRVRSIKTSIDTKIKLPEYAVNIVRKYKMYKTLLPQISNNQLNLNVKTLCEIAGWTFEVGKQRERLGSIKSIKKDGRVFRFCDLVTTHTMRRTAITTLLSLGMPETMVRKISGHSANSKEFYRYVNYAQAFIDKETDRVFSALEHYEKEPLKNAEFR